MSGILGMVSTRNIVPQLLQGLHQLEQPSHNTCGLVVHGVQGGLVMTPRLLRQRWGMRVSEWWPDGMAKDPVMRGLEGCAGIAHTGQQAPLGSRLIQQALPHWSHGPNADLNTPARVAVVHHGSLHNQQALREAGI